MAEVSQHNYPIGVMASGSGTTLEAVGHAIAAHNMPLEIKAVVYDRPGAGVAQRVQGLNQTYGWNIRTELVDKETFGRGPGENAWDITDEQSERMAEIFWEEGVVLVSLQGFLSKVRGELFEARGALPSHTAPEQSTILNNHPGFLWQTRGLYGHKVHKKVKDEGSDRTAVTFHVVSEDYDEGAIVHEAEVAVLPTYSWQDIEAAVQQAEKQHTAPTILNFIRRIEAYKNGRA